MAKNTIKGITVEIGGDTSKLGEALKDVDKKSRDLSSELGEINKLLKFDPGNAELLAQKQKVLADAVANTKEKLDTLKKAEEQVQKQFERGEVSEEQVRALKREIEVTAQQMKKYESAAQETAQAVDKLGDESEEAEKDADKLGDEAQETGKEIDKLGDESEEAEKEVDKLGDEAEETGKEIDKAGDKASTFGDKLSRAGSIAAAGIAAVAAAVGAVVTAMAKATVEAAAYADNILTLSTVTGISTEKLQEYSYAAELIDVSVDTITKSQAKQIKSMKAVQDGTKLAVDAYARLGIEVTNIDGSLRDGETVYWEVIDALGKMENETERDALAMQILGKSAQELNPLIEAGSERMKELGLEAHEMGAIMSEEALAAFGEFDDSLQRLKGSAGAAKNALGGVLLPELTKLAQDGTDLLSEFTRTLNNSGGGLDGFIATIDQMSGKIGGTVGNVLGDLVGKIGELAPSFVKVATSLVTTLASSLLDQVRPLTIAFMKLLTDTALQIAGQLPTLVDELLNSAFSLVDHIFYFMPDLMAACLELFNQLIKSIAVFVEGDMLDWLFDLVTDITNTITSAVPILLQAAMILFSAIIQAVPVVIERLVPEIIWMVEEFANALALNLPILLEGALTLFNALVQAIPQITTVLLEAVPVLVTTIVDCLVTNIPILIQGAIDLFNAIVQAIPVIIVSLVQQIPSIVTSIVDGLLSLIPVLLDGAQQLLFAIIDAIPFLLDELLPQIPIIVKTIIDGLLSMTGPLLDAAVQLLLMLVEAIPEIIAALIEALPEILDVIVTVLQELPGLIWNIALDVLFSLAKFFVEASAKGREGSKKILSAIVDALAQMPEKIWKWFQNSIAKVVQFGTDAAAKAKKAAKDIFNSIVDQIKGLPDEMLSIGKDLVEGLWNGIKDMTSWITGKLKSFGDSVLGGIKDFFGINSPSRVFRDEVGEMLAAGLAEGIEKNADQPLNAMAELSKDILGEADNFNGLTLARKLEHTFAAPSGPSVAESGMLDKLDRILSAIERGQILTIDGNTWVGGTVDRYDSALGHRRELVARGAL